MATVRASQSERTSVSRATARDGVATRRAQKYSEYTTTVVAYPKTLCGSPTPGRSIPSNPSVALVLAASPLSATIAPKMLQSAPILPQKVPTQTIVEKITLNTYEDFEAYASFVVSCCSTVAITKLYENFLDSLVRASSSKNRYCSR